MWQEKGEPVEQGVIYDSNRFSWWLLSISLKCQYQFWYMKEHLNWNILEENSVNRNHINRKSKIRSSQFSYTSIMNDMKVLEVVTKPSIFHGCSTQKTFWGEKLTSVNIEDCGCRNVRKHRDTKNGNQYIDLDISLNFGNLENIKITSS